MSPLKIEMLLQFYYSPDGYTGQSLGTPAYEMAMADFEAHGLLKDRRLTERGENAAHRLMAVPMVEFAAR